MGNKKSSNQIKNTKIIYFVLILALGWRLISINQSLWLDEAINVISAGNYSFWDFITKYPIGDFHPPGYFAILWVWVHLFGNSEVVVRFPSVLLGVGSVFLIYKIGKKFWNEEIGLAAALILALSPLHLYYSQEARMYSLATFAVCSSFWWFLNLLEKPNSRKNLYWYGLSIGFVLYSDYIAYLILPVQFLLAILLNRSAVKKILIGQIIGCLPLLPWLFVFPSQLSNGRQLAQAVPGWNNVVGGTNIKEIGLVWVKIIIGRISFDNKFKYVGVVGAVSIFYTLILYQLIYKRKKSTLIIFGWFFIPILIAYLVSFFIPVLSYFRLLFIVPAFSLLLAIGLNELPKKWYRLIIGLVLIINLFFGAIYLFSPKYQRENWKGLVDFLDTVSNQKSVVLLENNDLPAPFEYYMRKKTNYHLDINAQGALINFPATNDSDVIDLKELMQSKDKIYLVDYLVDISDSKRLVAQKLKMSGFQISNTYNFNGVGLVYEYSH